MGWFDFLRYFCAALLVVALAVAATRLYFEEKRRHIKKVIEMAAKGDDEA
jgi:hypothetical protein